VQTTPSDDEIASFFAGKIYYTVSEVKVVAEILVKGLAVSRCFALQGEIGAGKTTLIQSLLHGLGIQESVSSPTFTLEHRYNSTYGTILHYDLYRLEDIAQIDELGIAEALTNDYICLIEWPEIAYPILPRPFWNILIAHQHNNSRTLRIHLVI
jgi:tRNA threonylcarbamoyladenosine biosynthesis protein TsaE